MPQLSWSTIGIVSLVLLGVGLTAFSMIVFACQAAGRGTRMHNAMQDDGEPAQD